MSLNAYPLKAAGPELVMYPIRLLGTGAADPTKQYGPGVSVTRLGLGNYRVTFKSNPGTYVNGWGSVQHTTVAAASSNQIHIDSDSVTSTTVDFFVVEDDATPALVDLSSSMKGELMLVYARQAVSAV